MPRRSQCTFGHWQVECCPADGARLTRLAWAGTDLLTTAPAAFRPPARDYGRYETRPVYGYDDCFPTVDASPYPGCPWAVPDHGELCWREWAVAVEPDQLVCAVRSEHLPLTFTRRLRFAGHRLEWQFSVLNEGPADLPFLHVMHALLPLAAVTGLTLPARGTVYDEIAQGPLAEPGDVAARLLAVPPGQARMLILHDVQVGQVTVHLRGGLALRMTYPVALFPALGIWWNHAAYPDEEGCRRTECAFEPLGGPYSQLARSHAAGRTQIVPGRGESAWTIGWEVVPSAS